VPDPKSQSFGSAKKSAHGANLGGLFGTDLDLYPHATGILSDEAEPLRAAVVLLKLCDDSIENTVLEKVGRTLSYLIKLGLRPIVVLQLQKSTSASQEQESRDAIRSQADRLVTAIEKTEGQRAKAVENGFAVETMADQTQPRINALGKVRLPGRQSLLRAMNRGVIPVVAPLVFMPDNGKIEEFSSSDAVLALCRDLSDVTSRQNESQQNRVEQAESVRISLDRIIILDPLGGLPWSGGSAGSHLFVNLEQEYESIHTGLNSLESKEKRSHQQNIELARDALGLLPPSSSAIITTPSAAAKNLTRGSASDDTAPRNPLIHNLLTDKPLFSSSLPQSRLTTVTPSETTVAIPTLLKRGLPVSIFPSPRSTPWQPPSPSQPPFPLSSPALDLPRLVDLIEDSFQRPLDVEAYFDRIAPILAGIIVAGRYEGCAILTWEPVPPTYSSSGGGSDTLSSTEYIPAPVPYLDKLAVRGSSQGAGGVADILFNSMVRDCFPNGVVWRSRTQNPVNGWYFERAHGSWRLPQLIAGTKFTMFWTTPHVTAERFSEYAAVCGGLGSYFRDGKGGE
jgi:amino-acid N-acetyltransferase